MSRYSCLIAAAVLMAAASPSHAGKQHGIAMHGEPALPPDFTNFPYADPSAPKGGRITLGATGSFDSLNPLIVRGEPVVGMREFVIESLLARNLDEPFSLYGLLAESLEVPADRSSVTFHINPAAKFSDGKPVTAEDVIFSMELLREKGRPNHRTYYKKIERTEQPEPGAVKFVFKPAESAATGNGQAGAPVYDREMPLIMGLMPVLPKHAVDPEAFEKTSLSPSVGSGPYRVGAIEPGRSITYVRDDGYWGRDLPVNRGRYNFGEVRYEYFRDSATQFEAFAVGEIDLRSEDDPSRWAERYRFPATLDGRILQAEFPSGLPAGMTALVLNSRRPMLADPRVRQALIQLFNFEWLNRTQFHTLYKRTQSFFERSNLASIGGAEVRPADARELTLLGDHARSVKPEILAGTYRFPVSDGGGHNRENARKAYDLLVAAGYRLKDGKLVHSETGQQLALEVLASSPSFERTLSPFVEDLKRLGIDARIRAVDSAQYQSRLKDYDFDVIQYTWPASLSPGNEQLFRWSSGVADTPGSYNYAGVKNPAADAMIAHMLAAETAEDFTAAVRALDRVLLSGDYVIPLYYAPSQWIAHWRRLKHPGKMPVSGYNLDTWWIAEDAASSAP